MNKDRDWDQDSVVDWLARTKAMAINYQTKHRRSDRGDLVDMSAAEEIVCRLLETNEAVASRSSFHDRLALLRADAKNMSKLIEVRATKNFQKLVREFIDRVAVEVDRL